MKWQNRPNMLNRMLEEAHNILRLVISLLGCFLIAISQQIVQAHFIDIFGILTSFLHDFLFISIDYLLEFHYFPFEWFHLDDWAECNITSLNALGFFLFSYIRVILILFFQIFFLLKFILKIYICFKTKNAFAILESNFSFLWLFA